MYYNYCQIIECLRETSYIFYSKSRFCIYYIQNNQISVQLLSWLRKMLFEIKNWMHAHKAHTKQTWIFYICENCIKIYRLKLVLSSHVQTQHEAIWLAFVKWLKYCHHLMMHIKTYYEVMDTVYYFSALTLTLFIYAMKHTYSSAWLQAM